MTTAFHEKADSYLEAAFDTLEAQDTNALLEIDLEGGILTIELEDGRQWLISKHEPSGEMWLSSPISGGLHFSNTKHGWTLSDGRDISSLTSAEISEASGATFTF